MALTRSATVSVPVDVYVVVLVPSLTLMVPVVGIPRVNSEVLVVSGIAPVPVAGEPKKWEEVKKPDGLEEPEELELEEDDDEDALEPLDDDELPDEDCSALCTAVDSSVLTRFNAVWLAMLARPLAKLVMAEPIVVISVSVFASA